MPPTVVPKDVKPDGTGDYTTLNAFNAGEARNLVALNEVAKAVVYSGNNVLSGNGLFAPGWNTDATRYVWVEAAPGHEHHGAWDTNKAYGQATGAGNHCVHSAVFLRIDKMQFQNDSPGTVYHGGNCTLKMRRTIVRQSSGAGPIAVNFFFVGSSANNVIEDCLLIAQGTQQSICLYVENPFNVALTNCTLVSQGSGIFSSVGILTANAGAVVTSQNNYIYCGPTSAAAHCYFNGGGTINQGDNDSTCNAEATTPALRNIAYSAANFLDVTAGSENLHLTTGSALRGVGENLSATFTDDIDGETRPSLPAPWSIGADEPPHIYDVDFSDGGIFGDFFSAPTSGHVYVRPFKTYPTMAKVGARPVMTVTAGAPETRATV